MDTVQCVSNSLKFLSFALTSMHRLDAVKKLVAAAAIAAAAICPARAHFTYSLMMPRAVSASEVTHSTTQVP